MEPDLRLEVCADTVESCLAAQAGGAHRLELCSALAVGGVTPSTGLLCEAIERVHLPVVVLVRPRPGDFLFDASDLAAMRRDVECAREAGAAGVATGVLAADGTIDRDRTAELVAAARPLPVTFHRAFDMTRDLDEALEVLVELGIERVLTSGGAPDVTRGSAALARLVGRAGERIVVMPGGGVRADNARALVRACAARELHASASVTRPSAMVYRGRAVLGPSGGLPAPSPPGAPGAAGAAGARAEFEITATSAEVVRAILAAARG